MKHHVRLSGAGLAVLAACLAPAFVAAATLNAADTPAATPAQVKGPRLTVSETVHDFGRVAQGDTLQQEFELTNSGDAELQISEVKPSCGCTTTGEWPHTLQPGQSGKLPITIDTAHFVGPIIKTVTIWSNDPERPERTLELRAKIWTEISVRNPVLIFPAVTDPRQMSTAATTIRSEVDTPLQLSDLKTENPLFQPQLKEVIPNKEYELTVTTVPPLPDGTQTGRITMKSSNERVPQVIVQVVVTVLPAVQVAPSQFAFVAGKLTAPEKRYAVVLNHRGVDLQVSDVSTDAPGVTLTATLSADHKQYTIVVVFPAGFEIQPGQKYFVRGKTNQPTLSTFEIPIVAVSGR